MSDASVADDERAWFEAWCAGDAAAGRRFVARQLPAIARFFATKVGAAHEADDLTARTFEVLLTKRAQWRGEASPRTFLFGIAHHVLLGWARDRRRADDRFDPASVSAAALGPSMTSHIHARGQQRVLLAALRAIPLQAQVLLELTLVEGLSRAEVAAVLQLPEGTVASRLRRARAQLDEAIAAHAGSPELAHSTATDLAAWAEALRAALVPGLPQPP